MNFILGTKINMSQLFLEDGTVVPVTLVKAGPCQVTYLKSLAKDKYQAAQIGFGQKKRLSSAVKGHLKDLGNLRWLKEFLIDEKTSAELKRGDVITVGTFTEGEQVKISGTSKGKGFQGVVKKYGFHGHPATHGHKDQLRMPGSIGAGGVGRVFKGMRMGGHMGDERVTIKNLEIVKIDIDNNILYIKGAVPGTRNSLLEIVGTGSLHVIPSESQRDESRDPIAVEPTSSTEIADEKTEENKTAQTTTADEQTEQVVEKKQNK